jgi:hypothetical protein
MDPLFGGDSTAPGIPPVQPTSSGAHQKRGFATARAENRELRFHAAGALGESFVTGSGHRD